MTGRVWYGIAAALFAVTMLAFGGFVWSRVSALADELPQMVAPGTADMMLAQPGTYTVFHERVSVFDGRFYRSASDIAGLQVAVRSAAGTPLAVRPPGGNMSYSVGGREGVSIAAFDVSEPGWYRIGASMAGQRQVTPFVLAVGHEFGGNLVRTVLIALAIALAGFGPAIAIACITYINRRKAQRAPAAIAGAA